MKWLGPLVLVPLMAAPAPAQATGSVSPASPDSPVSLVYAKAAGCPDATQFWASVVARTPRARLTGQSDAAWSFQVNLERRDTSVVGRLIIDGRAGGHEERAARDTSCEHVADALALIVALTIDPNASLTPAHAAELPSSPRGLTGPPTQPDEHSPSRSPHAKIEGSLGIDALAEGASSAGISWGASVYTEVALARAPRPSVRLSFGYARGTAVATPVGAAQTELLLGALDACPARPAIAPSLLIGLCGRIELGILHAVGLALPEATSATATWVAPGGLARLEWAPSGPFRFEVQGGAVVPVPRHTLVLASPRTGLLDLPAVGATFAAGIGWRFL